MVREVVALALGSVGGVASSSRRTQGTPRRPSSIARIRPDGPPPTIATLVRAISLVRGEGSDGGEQRLDRLALQVPGDEHDSRAPVVARPGFEADRRMEHVLRALHHDWPSLAFDVD